MPVSGLEIPIIKLTVDHMKTSIMQAINPEQLSQQLEAATKQALAEIDFKKMIQNEIIHIAQEMLQDGNLMEPIRENISESLDKAINNLLVDAAEKEEVLDDAGT